MNAEDLVTNTGCSCLTCLHRDVCKHIVKHVSVLQGVLKDMLKETIIDEALDLLALHCDKYKKE